MVTIESIVARAAYVRQYLLKKDSGKAQHRRGHVFFENIFSRKYVFTINHTFYVRSFVYLQLDRFLPNPLLGFICKAKDYHRDLTRYVRNAKISYEHLTRHILLGLPHLRFKW